MKFQQSCGHYQAGVNNEHPKIKKKNFGGGDHGVTQSDPWVSP